MRRRDKWLIAIVVLVLLGVAIRAAMPTLIRDYVNDKLQALEGYDGRIEDVDLSIIRGAYGIDDIVIVKTGSGQPVPFFSSDRMEFSVEWRSLVKGSLVAEGDFFGPKINFVQAENKQESQTGEGVNWTDRFAELFPFKFNTVRVYDGTVTFTAPGISTRDAIKATKLQAELSNLTNVVQKDKETFADFRADARVLDGGSAMIGGSVDPLNDQPTFDVNLQVRNVKLPQVNPWLREYIKADAEAGDFELYLEMAAADGKFKGYAKPILEHVDIYSSEEPEENFLKRIWEGLVEFAANVLENDEKDQVAARIPFTGTIDDPKTSILETIVSVLHNAFISAFARSLEGSISVRAVRENLKGVGEPAADQGEKKKDDKKDEKTQSREPDFGPKRNN